MISITLAAVMAAASHTLAATTSSTASGTSSSPSESPSTNPTLGSPRTQGCFSSSGTLTLNTTLTFNSIGACASDICLVAGYSVAATMGGNECFCGDKYPPKDTVVDDSNCNIGCTGYDLDACGGIDYWTVYNTGKTLVVEYASDAEASSATASTTAAPTTTSATAQPEVTSSTAVVDGSTIVVTATTTPTPKSNKGSSTNTTGIAVGVVVGVVILLAIAGAAFFFIRRRRNSELEEEHRRNAAVNAFINGSKPGSAGNSMMDARLDPVMAQRRMSDGSIADNQDYSRRILRVTNA